MKIKHKKSTTGDPDIVITKEMSDIENINQINEINYKDEDYSMDKMDQNITNDKVSYLL